MRFFKTGFGPLVKSLGTEELGLARIRRDEEIATFLGTSPKWAGESILVEEKFEEFVDLKKIKAPRTHESIKGHWTLHIKPYFGSMRLEDVTESEWLRYVDVKRKDSPNRKFFNDRKYLSMFLNWLHREGFIKRIPKLEDVDPERNAGKVFSDEEIGRLLANARGDLRLQILMSLTMGMRKGEILSLEWSQVDFEKRSIFLPAEKTKIRKARTFALSAICLDLLRQRIRVVTTDSADRAWVFPGRLDGSKSVRSNGNQKSWEACKRAARVEGRYHDLRHSFLTKAFKQNVNPALICAAAGLSLQEAQTTYLHFSLEDLRVVSDLISI